MMNRPVEPNKEDCCNSGCNPCIFDVYEKQLLLFKKYQEGDNISESLLVNAISQLNYTQFKLVDNTELCEAHKRLSFKLSSPENNFKVVWKPGDHFLFKYTEEENPSCTRAFTPLKEKNNTEIDFFIIVKRYDKGVVSNYLYNLKPGQETLWRGPYGAYEIIQNKFNRIFMIAQGTGITPFMSIIENIIENEDDMTKLILLYCCHNVNSIPLRNELYSMKCYWNFSYTIFLGESNYNEIYKYQEPIINHKLRPDDFLQFVPFSENDQFLLCGSTNFMDYYKLWLKTQEVNNVFIF
ncbi:NADH-cytochrome b5 reductase-like [Ostrinia furnacalis]|uniref:NADH-cytochrome b5 reductase-like n=1 Tax=Ostrinia furnacalis TaxID=93504 RepID=UPI00103A2AA4|nr:NADH-cytochrome b5 reductase-like [Ostrinia furnacalis]